MSSGIAKVRTWEEFKRLIIEQKLDSIVYNIEQNGLSPARELTVLRLIVQGREKYHVFVDFPRGEKLRETGISLHRDKTGNLYIEDEDVTSFLKTQLKKEDLTICSYWTI